MDFKTSSSPAIAAALCKRLEEIRLSQNISQAELAKQAGVSRSTMTASVWFSLVNYTCYCMIMSSIESAHGGKKTHDKWEDVLILNVVVQLASIYTSWAKYVYLAIPGYAALYYFVLSPSNAGYQGPLGPTDAERRAAEKRAAKKARKQKRYNR